MRIWQANEKRNKTGNGFNLKVDVEINGRNLRMFSTDTSKHYARYNAYTSR